MEQTKTETKTITIKDTQFIILGTAHISKQSMEDVKFATEAHKVDCIAVELDPVRYDKLTNKESAFENLDVFSVMKQKKAMLLFSSILLSSFQRRLGGELNVKPGAEMLVGIEESKSRNIPCLLIDRPADLTLRRAWANSSFWGRQKIFATLIAMMFSKTKVSEEELQELKTSSLQGEMLQELANFLPQLKTVLLDERDEYLASKLLQHTNKHKRILVVLGAAHVGGVTAHLQQYLDTQKKEMNTISENTPDSKYNSTRLQELENIPKKFNLGTLLKFFVPIAVLALFVWGFIKGGIDTGTQNIIEWYLINGFLSLFGAIIALANPVTMIVAFVTAPFTSINPFLGVGFLTGLTEAWMRKPRVKDITDLQDIQLSVKNLYKNRVTRILLVFLCTTIGSASGTFIAIPTLFN